MGFFCCCLQLKAKMDEKRKIQAKKDAEEAKVNEAIRRKGGKDQQQIKQDLQLKEAEKAAIQRKKGEFLKNSRRALPHSSGFLTFILFTDEVRQGG